MPLKLNSSLDSFIVKNAPPTAYYVSEYISKEEEKQLLAKVYSAPIPKWTQLSNRRLQNWGGIPHSKGMIAESIPQWLDNYLDNIHQLNVMSSNKPNHVLVNEYLPGQGIMPHTDGTLFSPTITTISLGSHIVLKFHLAENGSEIKTLNTVCSLFLEPRSLLILKEDMFFKYLHSIEEVMEDVLSEDTVNLDLCKAHEKCVPRGTRVSLTIRHVPKTTVFKMNTNKR